MSESWKLFVRLKYRLHKNNSGQSSSNRIFILNYWCLLRFSLKCSHTIRRWSVYENGNAYFFIFLTWNWEIVHRSQLKKRGECHKLTVLFIFSAGHCVSVECICTNSILYIQEVIFRMIFFKTMLHFCCLE